MKIMNAKELKLGLVKIPKIELRLYKQGIQESSRKWGGLNLKAKRLKGRCTKNMNVILVRAGKLKNTAQISKMLMSA